MASSILKFCGRLSRPFQQASRRSVLDSVRINEGTRGFRFTPAALATTTLEMPSLSPTMEKGNIVKWVKKEGDTISAGDVLCEIETDKAIVSMDTEEEGILAKILMPENSKDVPVGQLIALMVEEGDDWQNVEVPAGAGAVAAAASSPATPVASAPSPAPAAASADSVEHGHLIGPSVKKLLQEYGLKSADIPATGRGGGLLKGDVLNYIMDKNVQKVSQAAPAPAAATAAPSQAVAPPTAAPSASGESFVDIPLTNMRRTIAKRLTESKTTIPHAYASIDSDIAPISQLRKSLAVEGVKVSVNDFIIKAAAMALQRVPQVNGIFTNDHPQLSSTTDISVAVATPNGLITPIVRGAGSLSVDDIGSKVKEMAGRAREGKLKPEEFQGGSFSISNLGMFGISEFTAVINLPQMAIMAVGTSRNVASMKGNQTKMMVTLSYDSRGINELEATRFLEEFRHVMENPQSMLAGTRLDAAAEAFAF